MTDFLGRVAARAVGAAAAAQPRLPGLFEPTEAALFEVHDEVVVPAAATPAPAAVPAAPDAGADRPPAAAAAQPPAAGAQAPVPRTPPPPREAEVTPAPLPTAGAAPHELDRLQPAAPPTPSPPAAPVAPGVAVAAAPLAQALPARPAGGPSNSLSRAAVAAPVRAEPPPVRVHIGRLEVRANVHEPPREQPRRERSRPEGLSLADYLRGKREAGA